jgi:hypothetical protein
MYISTRSSWRFIASGPSWVSGSSEWTYLIPFITPAIASASSSWRCLGTIARDSIAQTCPLSTVMVLPRIPAAASIGKSSRTIAADLPPSSSVQRAMRLPQTSAMRLPATVEPVKLTLSIPGLLTRWSDASRSPGRG